MPPLSGRKFALQIDSDSQEFQIHPNLIIEYLELDPANSSMGRTYDIVHVNTAFQKVERAFIKLRSGAKRAEDGNITYSDFAPCLVLLPYLEALGLRWMILKTILVPFVFRETR